MTAKKELDEIDAYDLLNSIGNNEGRLLRNFLRMINDVQGKCIEFNGKGEVHLILKLDGSEASGSGTPFIRIDPVLKSKAPDISNISDFFYVDEDGSRYKKDPGVQTRFDLG